MNMELECYISEYNALPNNILCLHVNISIPVPVTKSGQFNEFYIVIPPTYLHFYTRITVLSRFISKFMQEI
jgi:hypothetical protein